MKWRARGDSNSRPPALLLRRYTVQNSKCRCWCRLRGSASFISPLNWTEVGLKCLGSPISTYFQDFTLLLGCREIASFAGWSEPRVFTNTQKREGIRRLNSPAPWSTGPTWAHPVYAGQRGFPASNQVEEL